MLHPCSDIPLVSGNSTALHLPLSVVKQSLFLSTPREQTEAHTGARFLPPDSGSHISFDCLRCPMGRKCLLSLQSGHCDVSYCRSRKVSPAKTQLYTDDPACIIPNGLKHITMLLHAFHQAMAKTTTTTLTKDNDSFIRSISEVLQMLPQKKKLPCKVG